MQANLEWIQHEWLVWIASERGRKINPRMEYKVGVEHVAKLFAAHCLEALHAQVESGHTLVEDEPKRKQCE